MTREHHVLQFAGAGVPGVPGATAEPASKTLAARDDVCWTTVRSGVGGGERRGGACATLPARGAEAEDEEDEEG